MLQSPTYYDLPFPLFRDPRVDRLCKSGQWLGFQILANRKLLTTDGRRIKLTETATRKVLQKQIFIKNFKKLTEKHLCLGADLTYSQFLQHDLHSADSAKWICVFRRSNENFVIWEALDNIRKKVIMQTGCKVLLGYKCKCLFQSFKRFLSYSLIVVQVE